MLPIVTSCLKMTYFKSYFHFKVNLPQERKETEQNLSRTIFCGGHSWVTADLSRLFPEQAIKLLTVALRAHSLTGEEYFSNQRCKGNYNSFIHQTFELCWEKQPSFNKNDKIYCYSSSCVIKRSVEKKHHITCCTKSLFAFKVYKADI